MLKLNFIKQNIDWNADPNAPQVKLNVKDNSVSIEFYANYFVYNQFKEGDKLQLTFINCHKYSFNSMNDEGYYMDQYRYSNKELPWGEFYILNTDWKIDFPSDYYLISGVVDERNLKHYIFFFKDNTFECVAERYELR